MNKLFYSVIVLVVAVVCTNNELHNNAHVQRYNRPNTVAESFSLNTREEIDKISKGYGLKGFHRIGYDDKIIETKGTIARLRKKDIQDSKQYWGGNITPGTLEIIPPEMIRPLDGSEGDPLFLNVIAEFMPVASFSENIEEKAKRYISGGPKFYTTCTTVGGITTCSTY